MTSERRREINDMRIDTLNENLRADVHHVLSDLETEGFFPLVTQAFRSPQLQDALYAQGRKPLEEVNQLRKIAGEDPIGEEENKVVTNSPSGKSLHEKGEALDIVNFPDGGSPEWNNMKFYSRANELFSTKGFRWGGTWKSWKDFAHYESD